MTEFRGVLGLQVDSLLEALRSQRDVRCREIESNAARTAKQLLRDSRRKLRGRLHQAVDEERKRRERALLEAQHRIETAGRRRVQARYGLFLRDARPRLISELRARWSGAESRRAWCEMLIEEARDKLDSERWTVELPGAWSANDTRWLKQTFDARGLPEPSCRTEAGIEAGLRIRLGTASLDATVDGLLSHRAAVDARLLAAWERQASQWPENQPGESREERVTGHGEDSHV